MPRRIGAFLHDTHIAYFSMEIALIEDMHTYSGGLGVLAGDTARSCADLGIPVVFVSLVSRQGYLRQEIDDRGRQVDHPDPWEPAKWATPLDAMIAVTLEGRPVWIRPWLYLLGCPPGNAVPIILLDTDLEENNPNDREITHHLYGGDETYRLKQEAVLGIGGARILRALGFEIHTYHLNEGHAALSAIELLQQHPWPDGHMQAATLYDADPVLESCIFTTHTPIESAHERFPYDMISSVLGEFVELSELKRYAGADECNMTRLALSLCGYVNGVATRHADTTRHMFPGYRVHAVTNGVHTPTWTHRAFAGIYDLHFPRWSHEPEILIGADQLADDDVWAAHCAAKEDLLRLVKEKTGVVMAPDKPLLGFARRMTGYKRPELLFTDIARLRAVCAKHPFQVVWAGKAHPKDTEGKRLIEHVNAHIRELAGEIPMAFLPNYDLGIAASMVAGSDIWVNTPLPPLEASGTSGMKAAINGVLNLSVLDGWWIEAWLEDVTGWSIGHDHLKGDNEAHARDLYDKLETKILPLYYGDRSRWTWMMKQSISKIASYFNSQRMMRRYATEAYLR